MRKAVGVQLQPEEIEKYKKIKHTELRNAIRAGISPAIVTDSFVLRQLISREYERLNKRSKNNIV